MSFSPQPPEALMSEYRFLQWEVADGIAVVWLNRAPVNAVDRDMYIEIAELFRNPFVIDAELRVVILAARGPHFCAGNDLDEFATMTPDNGSERMWRVREAFFAIQDCPLPVIGAVQGAALGTGLAIAASCDFVIAGEGARFGLPELSVGVMGGARHLARMAPQPLVRRMFFTGEHLAAADFARAGGCVVVVPDGQLLSAAQTHARRIAAYSPTAVPIGKAILNRIEDMDIKAGYAFEQAHTVQLSGHPDSKEALRAIAERREARYLPRGRL